MGTPEDVAGAIAFFASEDSAFVTGASLLVDGGLMAQVPT
jgi:NAD(P)-dependent dehydrogenase (short-subunit alcohol dehydrogenase family)